MIVALLLAGCPHPTPAEEPVASTGEIEVDGTLRVDPEPGGKRFQGVWIEADGTRWVVAYRAWGWLTPFDGQAVSVTGAPYTPDPRAQAILAPHLRLDTLRVDPAAMTRWVSIGPERTLSGRLATETGDAGTKSEGESWRVLATDEATWPLANPADVTAPDGPITVIGRILEPSPFYGGRTDPVVWVVSVP